MAPLARKESLIMARKALIAATITVGLAVGAAAPAHADWRDRLNPSLYSVKQPVVQRTDYVIDLNSGNGVSPRELERLSDWFETLGVDYGDRISVDTGSYDDARARQDVASVAARYGLLLSRGVPVTAGSVQPGSVRVVVSRSEAYVPGCPDWSEAPEIGNRITTASNFGCATNSNLAAMIADPNDLVRGRTGALDNDASSASKAVTAYRGRTLTGNGGSTIQSESSKGGK